MVIWYIVICHWHLPKRTSNLKCQTMALVVFYHSDNILWWVDTRYQCPVACSLWRWLKKVSQVDVTDPLNSLRPRQNRRRFADETFKRSFLNENVRIAIKISLKFVPKGPINNNPALVQIMAWRRPGDKPLSEPMMVSLLTHICVNRPQWVNFCAKKLLACDVIVSALLNKMMFSLMSHARGTFY